MISSLRLAHRQGRVSKVVLRTSTSILLLSILVAGILSPSGLCALMCGRHLRTERQRPCSHAPEPMSGMRHHHSATMNAPDANLMNTRCSSNCDVAAFLSISRKPTAQIRAAKTAFLQPHLSNKDTATDIASAFRWSGGWPAQRTIMLPSSILRI